MSNKRVSKKIFRAFRPRISRDTDLEKVLVQKLMNNINRPRQENHEEIYVTELVYCLKKAFYKRMGIQERTTEKNLIHMILGKASHYILERYIGLKSEIPVEKYGVKGRIDVYDKRVIEIKTVRNKKIRVPTDIPEHYKRQIAYYIILADSESIGILILLDVISGKITAYKIDYSDCIQYYRWEFFSRLEILRKALRTGDERILENTGSERECRHCGFAYICSEAGKPKRDRYIK